MQNSKFVTKKVGGRIKAAREDLFSRQGLCDVVNRLAADDNRDIALNEATLKQWEYGNNRIDIEWIPYLCRALNCDVGYLFGEYLEKHHESTDIRKETGLSEDSIVRLTEIDKMDKPVKSVIHAFLDDLLDNISLIDMAIAYKQFKSGDLSDCYVIAPNGVSVDFFDKDLPLLILQNKFTRFVLDSRVENRFSWKDIRKEQMASAVTGALPIEFQEDIERGK